MPRVPHQYHFTSTWTIPSAPLDVYRALEALSDYPSWWPQFRSVGKINDGQYRMTVRSFLPYNIDYVLSREIADQGTGLLQGWATGDIVGRIRWEIRGGAAGTIVSFDEDVVTALPLLNLLAPIARPAFELNHRLMMHDGRVGLTAYLGSTGEPYRAPGAADGGAWRVVPMIMGPPNVPRKVLRGAAAPPGRRPRKRK